MFSNDISDAIKSLLNQGDVKKIAENSIEEITNEAYDKLVVKCEAVNLSNHIGFIDKKIESRIGTISTSDAAIIFKELGTGIIGSNNPHPDSEGMFAGWKYDVNSHGEKGWYYPKNDGSFGWTKGLPANAMFYNTYSEMLEKSGNIVQQKLNNIIK